MNKNCLVILVLMIKKENYDDGFSAWSNDWCFLLRLSYK